MARPRVALADRLERWSIPEPNSGCVLWLGALTWDGYGYIGLRDAAGKAYNVRAHRAAYELRVGPIRDGLVIDHLCRVRCCINPDHLEVVTQHENLRRSPLFNGGKSKWKARPAVWTGPRLLSVCSSEQHNG